MAAWDAEIADKLLKAVALYSGGIICGNALFVSLVSHPSILSMPTMETAARSWYEMFDRTKNLQMKASVLHSIGTFGTYALNKYRGTSVSPAWLFSGLVVNGILPYTLVFMMPTNKILLKHDTIVQEKGDKWVKEKIEYWGNLHAVRTVANVVAFGVLCYTVCS